MKKKKKILFPILGYGGIVLFFAVVYYGMFLYDHTSFLLTEQMNKHLNRYNYLEREIDLVDFQNKAKDIMPISISDFCELIKPDRVKLSSINDSLKMYQNRIDKCLSEQKNLFKYMDEKRTDSIKAYKETVLHECQQKIDSLKRYIESHDSTEMIIEGKYVVLSHLELDYANLNAKVCTYVVEKYGSFVPSDLVNRNEDINKEIMYLGDKRVSYEESKQTIQDRIHSLELTFEQNRRNSVNFLDFIYYSICVSTTVSFGDIAPNSTCTRLASILELLLCIVLIGFIVSFVQNKNN